MISLTRSLAVLALLGAGAAATAHEGASGDVKTRMEAMKTVADNTKILGGMATGKRAFDAADAQAAAAVLEAEAARIPALFESGEMSEVSEASPEIWENWGDFTAKSEDLAVAAARAGDVTDLDGLRAAMGGIGGACKACHQDYRIEKD